jgi:hypothetical protein
MLAGRSHAIYAKTGDANAATTYSRVAIVSLQAEYRDVAAAARSRGGDR